MNKEGVPINNFDPKPAVKKNAEAARDWEYSREAQFLYGMAVLFKDRLLDPVLRADRGRLPDPVISFENLRNKKTLATYTLHRSPQGLLDEITFNTTHYKETDGQKVWSWGKWAQLETLLHEQVHLWQQNFGEHPVRPGKVSHNKEFVEKCESLGLHPMPVVGCHTQVADGVFAKIMGELGIPRPADVPREETTEWTRSGGIRKDWFRTGKEKGKSTLHKWSCPDCGMAVRIGIGGDPQLVHDVCSEIKGEKVFLVKHDGLPHVIYAAEDDDKNPAHVIEEINKYLREGLPERSDAPTIENIAQKLGISKFILYGWAQTDAEFSSSLVRLLAIQKDDPFKTGTEEDAQLSELLVAIVLMETRDRHYKPQNQ